VCGFVGLLACLAVWLSRYQLVFFPCFLSNLGIVVLSIVKVVRDIVEGWGNRKCGLVRGRRYNESVPSSIFVQKY